MTQRTRHLYQLLTITVLKHSKSWSSYSNFSNANAQEKWKQFVKGASADNLQDTMGFVWQEVKDAVLPRNNDLSPTRIRPDTTPLSQVKIKGPSEMIQAQKKKTMFSTLTDKIHQALEGTPLYSRIRGLTNQGKEFASDLKDKIESSDHPMMHKIQDYHENFYAESGSAKAMREIVLRDPNFNMVDFLKNIKLDVPIVIKAYLEGKESILRQHCTDELLEKLMGLYRHSELQGAYQDSTILFIDEVEPFDAMFVDKQPVIVATFSCQQINCLRDKFGNIVEGKEDEIHQVYYAWALEQDEQGAVDANGQILPPRWQVREMMIRGFHALL